MRKMIRQKRIDRNLLYVFLSVPLLSSIMSAIHLVHLVGLGNPFSMAIALAVTFELGSIVSFIAMSKSILKRLKKEALYFIFGILFLLQAFGNVYSSFDYIREKLLVDPTWLDGFREMFFNALDVTTAKLSLAMLIGLPIPIISLILLKSAIDYFGTEEEDDDTPKQNEELPKDDLPGTDKPADKIEDKPEINSKEEVVPEKKQQATERLTEEEPESKPEDAVQQPAEEDVAVAKQEQAPEIPSIDVSVHYQNPPAEQKLEVEVKQEREETEPEKKHEKKPVEEPEPEKKPETQKKQETPRNEPERAQSRSKPKQRKKKSDEGVQPEINFNELKKPEKKKDEKKN